MRRQDILQEPQEEKEKEIDKLENVEQSPVRFYFFKCRLTRISMDHEAAGCCYVPASVGCAPIVQ